MGDPAETVALYALGAPGAELCRRLAASMEAADLHLARRHAKPEHGDKPFDSLHTVLAQNFSKYSGHVLVCAAGMVIRCLAPLLQSKDKDPAVVVVDQQGRFAVSLLSGHLGGANTLALRVAEALGGQAVITTATDNLGLPSLELEARHLGMGLENLGALAGVSGALVDGRKVPVYDPGGWLSQVTGMRPDLFELVDAGQAEALNGSPLVWVDWRNRDIPAPWLVLRPRCLALGMGCNRDTLSDEMVRLALSALAQAGASPKSLGSLASAEAKRDEPGLLEAARQLGVEPKFFDHGVLAGVAVPNPSEAAMRCLGTPSVCEAAAILASGGGELIITKTKSINATAAVAIK